MSQLLNESISQKARPGTGTSSTRSWVCATSPPAEASPSLGTAKLLTQRAGHVPSNSENSKVNTYIGAYCPKAIVEATKRRRWLQRVTQTILKSISKRHQKNHSMRVPIASYWLERKTKVTSWDLDVLSWTHDVRWDDSSQIPDGNLHIHVSFLPVYRDIAGVSALTTGKGAVYLF